MTCEQSLEGATQILKGTTFLASGVGALRLVGDGREGAVDAKIREAKWRVMSSGMM